MNQNFLPFETIKNIRDLGNISTIDGRIIKSGLLLRSGHLYDLSDEEFKILKKQYDLKVVVDFRSTKSTIYKKPNIDETIKYYHFYTLDFLEHNSFTGDLEDKIDEFFSHVYYSLASAEEAMRAFRNFINVLIETPEGAILYHCTAGKDRTGVATAILMLILGCSKEEIYREYFRTNEITGPILKEQLQATDPHDYKKISYYKAFYTAKKEYLDLFFETIEKKFQTINNYIKDGLKLNHFEINLLREKYLI